MAAIQKILIRLLLVTSPFWAFCCYLEYKLNGIDNSYSYKMKEFEANEKASEILVLGKLRT